MPDLGTVLGVWAHPDDEAYLSAALMTDAARKGNRVVCVTATRGEAGSQDPERWPPEEMARIRERELAECLGILGVDDHRWLDYRDGTCDAVAHDDAVGRLEPIFAEVQPDTVLTFGPEGLTGHPDHMAVSEWTADAFDRFAPTGARLYYAVHSTDWLREFGPALEPYNVFAPGLPPTLPRDEIEISFLFDGELAELKVAALRAQVSQTDGLFTAVGSDFIERGLREESFRLARTKR